MSLSLDLASLARAYADGALTPTVALATVYDRIASRGEDHVWIHLVPRAEALAAAARLEARRAAGETLPLYGLPFAVKDNIDVAGLPTTAACPEFGYTPAESATVVQRLLDAGALCLGKTNLDQFATGLVGTRSPYGAPSSVFDARFISGGSSSGSAVAVAAGLVSFALGTDTAGSGRVPAAFNNLVGWKPTRGLLSNRGLVPACRSLDCISVFALTCADAQAVADVVSAFDAADAYSRPAPGAAGLGVAAGMSVGAAAVASAPAWPSTGFRFGVPRADQLEFFGDAEAATLFAAAVARLEALGGVRVTIDFAPFRETAQLLYSGPWIAERLAAVEEFLATHPDAMHPVTKQIISGGTRFSAVDTFRALYRLEELRRVAEAEWTTMDVLLVPTAPTIFTHAQLAAEPVRHNTELGTYTNFVNLLDLCGVAVPAGFRPDGLPLGVTLLAPAFADAALLALGGRLHAALGGKLGGTAQPLAALPAGEPSEIRDGRITLAVVGAHLSGQPLNVQLTSLGARLLRATRTAAGYRLFALRGTVPAKPGLVRAPEFVGPGIELEVWSLDAAAFGQFTAAVPPPLAIGNVQLADGSWVKGFVCEPAALDGATEITAHGGWRAYLGALGSGPAAGETPPVHGSVLSAPPVPQCR